MVERPLSLRRKLRPGWTTLDANASLPTRDSSSLFMQVLLRMWYIACSNSVFLSSVISGVVKVM